MPIPKKYEMLIIAPIAIAAMFLIVVIGKVFANIPELTIFASYITGLVSYLVNYDVVIIKGTSKNSVITFCTFVCAASMFFFMYSATKNFAIVNNYLFKGSVENREVFVEGDGETRDHYKTVYYFEYENSKDKDYKDLIEWLVTTIYFIPLFLSFQNLKRNQDATLRGGHRNNYT